MSSAAPTASTRPSNYHWVALANTTAAVFMSTLDGSIVLIAMPAIFAGIHLNPLEPANIGFLLWMIMGYRLVQAVLVVPVGWLGDLFGRVKIYNAGFMVFTISSVLLSFDPFRGGHAALWLIAWRFVQAFGGSMLTANSAAILTDAFPAERRGFALGTNQVAGLAGQFIGLTLGGLLAAWDWRAVFWVNVPVGIFGTWWAYTRLREVTPAGGTDGGKFSLKRMDWWGSLAFTVGLSAVLVGITEALHPYGHHTMGWTSPYVLTEMIGGVVLLVAFILIEAKVAEPMIRLGLFKIRAFAAGNLASLAASIARGGMQFILVIWLQGVWLPLHGYSFSQTPLWAGIYLIPLSIGFLVSGPISGTLSDKFGSRGIATSGMLLFSATFVSMIFLPIDFPYWLFAVITFINGVSNGMFTSPNTSAIMGSVPAKYRGVASGMRATFMNSGTALSIGIFFSLMIAGLSTRLPHALTTGLISQGVDPATAAHVGSLPPVSTLFAAMLGVDPIANAVGHPVGGATFLAHLLANPFHHGLVVVFTTGAVLGLFAAIASVLRGAGIPSGTEVAAHEHELELEEEKANAHAAQHH